MKTLQTKLDAIRSEIEALAAERAQTEAAPISRTECEDLIAAVVDAPWSDQELDPAPAGLLGGSFDSVELRRTVERPGAFRAIVPAALKTYLIALYDAALGDAKPGLPAAERRKRMVDLDAEIFRLEVDEEGICEELEAAGADVLRRGDASAAAQLGLDVRDAAA